MPTLKEEKFTHAGTLWDLPRLYADLATVKGEKLTATERLHLRGLLCGHSPAKLAKLLYKSVRGVQANICGTITQWVKILVVEVKQVVNEIPPKMAAEQLLDLLEQAGYKKTSMSSPTRMSMPVETLEGVINVDNLKLNQYNCRNISIEFNLRVVTNMSVEQLSKILSQSEVVTKLLQLQKKEEEK